MRLRRLLLGAAVLAASAILHAQQQAIFRTETNYVELDAVVTDAGGHFAPGLTAADFEIREQGRPQSISTFTNIDMPMGPGKVSSTPSPVLFRPDLPQTERLSADRVYLLYLNAASPLLVRVRAREFVRDFLQPNDIAAVWDAESPRQNIAFTNNKETLLAAIGPGAGAGPAVSGSPSERAATEGSRLRDAVDWLSGIQGRRKSLILFTEGWRMELGAPGQPPRTNQATDWLVGRGPGLIDALMWPSDVHIYAYDVRGLVAPDTHLSSSASALPLNAAANARFEETENVSLLRTIADQTGGLAFVASNDYRRGFARIVEDNSRYYMLGYYSPNVKRDGAFLSLTVHVTRPGLRVRARSGYLAR